MLTQCDPPTEGGRIWIRGHAHDSPSTEMHEAVGEHASGDEEDGRDEVSSEVEEAGRTHVGRIRPHRREDGSSPHRLGVIGLQ